MSRWIELYATSPSGKALFVCKFCGSITPAPTKSCSSPPEVVSYKQTLSCALLAEIEAACIDEGTQEKQEFPVLELYMPGNHGEACLRMRDGTRRHLKVEKRE